MCSGFGNIEAKSSFDKSLNGVSSTENEVEEVQTGGVNNVFNDFSVKGSNGMAKAGGGFQDACVLMGMAHLQGKIS